MQAICHIRKRNFTSSKASKPVSGKNASVLGNRKTVAKQQGNRDGLAIRFPATDRTETNLHATSGSRTHSLHSPDRVSNGVSSRTTKPRMMKQSSGSASLRKPQSSSSPTAYRLPRDDKRSGMAGTGSRRVDAVPRRAGSSTAAPSAKTAASKISSLGVEGVKIRSSTRPSAQFQSSRGRGEERRLSPVDPPQYHTPHLKDERVYHYRDVPKPLNPTSNRDRDL